MKYTKFGLKNFKGVKEVAIDVNGNEKPMALVGLNESGKTTILEGVEKIAWHCKHIFAGKGGKLNNERLSKNMMPKPRGAVLQRNDCPLMHTTRGKNRL